MKPCVEQVDRNLDWQRLDDLAAWVIEQGIAIQQIAAPTFHEQPRAAWVAEQFRALGLGDVEMDDLFNVYGRLPGQRADLPAIMVSAHSDTIFAQNDDLTIRRDEEQIYGPGLGDNSMGVAAMLGLLVMLREQNIQPECDLWLVATTREEGLGDLGGIKAAFHRLKTRVNQVINLEGLAFGHIYHAGIAVRRLHITLTAPGGHSWLHYGRTSAIHSLLELGARLAAIRPPPTPRTTLNIGTIDGGQSINAIASRASLWLDMRSEDRTALAALENAVRAQIQATRAPDLTVNVEVVGDRPAGYLAPTHPLVQGALAALQCQGVRGQLETGSTDGNLPLSEGCPAVTIGITRGGNAHRLDEYIETAPVRNGLRQLVTLVVAAARYQAEQA